MLHRQKFVVYCSPITGWGIVSAAAEGVGVKLSERVDTSVRAGSDETRILFVGTGEKDCLETFTSSMRKHFRHQPGLECMKFAADRPEPVGPPVTLDF